MLKVGFFSPSEIIMLHQTHLLLLHLLSLCVHLYDYDFLWLSEYKYAWEQQTKLSST